MSRLRYLVCLLTAITLLAIPQTLKYQGKLTDLDGVGENDTLEIRFNLYDVATDGDSLWTQTLADVPVVHGLFDVDLGPVELPFDEQYWLEIVVAGNTLTPRVKLTTSPYAFRAAVADSLTGGVPPGLQDTMVAYWDSLRGIPADIADGDQFDTTIAHWGSIRDIPAEIEDGDQIDTMIAYWDSIRGIPGNLGNSDTIWSKDSEIADTIVMMANTKVHGELIADSIQAVGDNVVIDDNLDIYGCETINRIVEDTLYLEGFESGDPPTGWEETGQTGTADLSYETESEYPVGYSPTEGTLLLQFNSVSCLIGNEITLQQTSGFSTEGYVSISLNLDVLHDLLYDYADDRFIIKYSLDGISWIEYTTLHRYDGSTGWATETIMLPDSLAGRTELYLGIRFISHFGYNIHIDNLVVTGRTGAIHTLASICGDGMEVNGNLDISGDLNVDNDITANTFHGDGSALTGIVAEDDDWTIAGINMYATPSGNVGIGTTTPSAKLEIAGATKTTTFQMTNGASDGYILQSDVDGNGSWIDPGSISGTTDFDTINATRHDTVVVSEALKVQGELIADSIQAVGDVVTVDDNLDIYGCMSIYGNPTDVIYAEGFESGDPPAGWEETGATGSADLNYVGTSQAPSGYNPTEGDIMLRFNSYSCVANNEITLQQTTGFSASGYESIVVNFDMLHDTERNNDDRVYLKYSLDGVSWVTLDSFYRYDGTTGWNTESVALPDSLSNRPAIYLALRFVSDWGNNVHLDNLVVTATMASITELASICGDGVNFHGDLTANSFTGDGSGLTNIDDQDWERDGNYLRAYNSSDSVIIGGLNPVDVLDVRGSMTIRGDGKNGPNGTDYTSDEESIRLTGSTSDYIIAVQDGSGRIQHYWNSTTSSPDNIYLVDDEPAWMWDVTVNNNPYMEFKFAPEGTAGDVISWTTHMAIDTNGDVDILGDVTANAFIGDGSGLTGIGAEDDDWTVSGDDIYSAVSGNVGIGTTNPEAKLDVQRETSSGFHRGNVEIYHRGFGYGNALVAISNESGTNTYSSLYSFAKLAVYDSLPSALYTGAFCDIGVWGHSITWPSTETYGVLATNGVNPLDPDVWAYLAGRDFAGYFSDDVKVDSSLFVMSKVGIGTSSPSDLLQIAGATDAGLTLTGVASSPPPMITMDNPDNNQASVITNRDGDALNIEYDGNKLINIDTLGALGIGVNDPSQKLDIDGSINIAEGAGFYIGGNKILSHLGSTVSEIYLGNHAAESCTSGYFSTIIGTRAGQNTLVDSMNTFVGAWAGADCISGKQNCFIGYSAGSDCTDGNNNVHVGFDAGMYSTGSRNVLLGRAAGYHASGSGNVFIGDLAGYNETGSDLLYIDNSSTGNPLIWGDFDANEVEINGDATVDGTTTLNDDAEVNGNMVLNGSLNWGGISTGTAYPYNITIDGIDSYTAGMVVAFQTNVLCGAAPTLSINGMAAKNIRHANKDIITTGEIEADDMIVLIYNGSNFRWISD